MHSIHLEGAQAHGIRLEGAQAHGIHLEGTQAYSILLHRLPQLLPLLPFTIPIICGSEPAEAKHELPPYSHSTFARNEAHNHPGQAMAATLEPCRMMEDPHRPFQTTEGFATFGGRLGRSRVKPSLWNNCLQHHLIDSIALSSHLPMCNFLT